MPEQLPVTTPEEETKKEEEKKQDGLNLVEKAIGGLLLVLFTVLPVYVIVAYWPDRLPGPKEAIRPLYIKEAFHVRLACVTDTVCCADTLVIKNSFTDTLQKIIRDTAQVVDSVAIDSNRVNSPAAPQRPVAGELFVIKQQYYFGRELIHLNTLLLILVAAAGFAGNMIHIATSLTTYVGSEKFKRSWLLWYWVKPFSAAALAICIYFVFRGGFLNMSNDAVNINLYGVMTISLLAGLFTDIATQKLKEVFETLFKPKDNRPDKLTASEIKINAVTPEKLSRQRVNTIVLTGEKLNDEKLVIKINEDTIPAANITIAEKEIRIQYKIEEVNIGKTEFKLFVLNAKSQELFTKVFGVE